MDTLNFTGQTLDGKYQVARELGRGGMGTVYLATHLGTERPVAVKIIAPQYMQRSEFVERFRREARAAGRLRHPNVVNVTDFGFAETKSGQVAYLVMEYLDGCTLGEILDEEKNLPVSWTLDILEQVCSAVHEAHLQGIIHRDLKPDNIWLEPNQRGGYTVKVLDFGIAKLEGHEEAVFNGDLESDYAQAVATLISDGKATFAGMDREPTKPEGISNTQVTEAATLVPATSLSIAADAEMEPVNSEGETAIFNNGDESDHESHSGSHEPGTDASAASSSAATAGRSLYDSHSSTDLTRVGSVLGTPLYMSPEQCRGEHLGPSSDIYSLGVIAYQMLSGAPPFEGDFKDVMESHKSVEPPPLKAKKVRRKFKRVIHSTLAKDPAMRPQSAEAFASELRSRSEGIFGLLRRALVIYSEHLPKFLMLTGFFSIPMVVLTVAFLALSFLKVSDVLSANVANTLIGLISVVLSITTAFCTNLIVGTTAWIVTQSLAVPLRPVRLRPAMAEARKKWKRMAGAGFLTATLPFMASGVGAIAGFLFFGTIMGILYPLTGSVGSILVGGLIGALILGFAGLITAYVMWILVPPVIVMENTGIFATLKRSVKLVRRSIATSAGAVMIMFLIPMTVVGTITLFVNLSGKAFDSATATKTEKVVDPNEDAPETESPAAEPEEKKDFNWNWSLGSGTAGHSAKVEQTDMRTRVKQTVVESLIQVLWLPMQILVFSFSGIIVALLYLKTRLAGGESMNDLIERFEDDGRPRKKWQERVRNRLIQSGRISSKP